MSKVLARFDFRSTRKDYPWHRWSDGRIHKLTHGVDFDTDPRVFRMNFYAGKGHGRYRTSIQGTDLIIQRID